jgi:hypothetical protein
VHTDLSNAGHRGVEMRLVDMITNRGPHVSRRLVERQAPIEAQLSFEPQSFADLYRRAKVRPLTRFDETETAAAWIAIGMNVEILKSELRFSRPLVPDEFGDRPSLAEHYARQQDRAKLGRAMRKERDRRTTA